jgi:hypothetical protein
MSCQEQVLKFIIQARIKPEVVRPEITSISRISVELVFKHRCHIKIPAFTDLIIEINPYVSTKIEIVKIIGITQIGNIIL